MTSKYKRKLPKYTKGGDLLRTGLNVWGDLTGMGAILDPLMGDNKMPEVESEFLKKVNKASDTVISPIVQTVMPMALNAAMPGAGALYSGATGAAGEFGQMLNPETPQAQPQRLDLDSRYIKRANGGPIINEMPNGNYGTDQIPTDSQGMPTKQSGRPAIALTDAGEVTWNGYVFSKDLGFAPKAKSIMNKYKMRLGDRFDKGDKYAQAGLDKAMTELAQQQEAVRPKSPEEQQGQQLPGFHWGGKPGHTHDAAYIKAYTQHYGTPPTGTPEGYIDPINSELTYGPYAIPQVDIYGKQAVPQFNPFQSNLETGDVMNTQSGQIVGRQTIPQGSLANPTIAPKQSINPYDNVVGLQDRSLFNTETMKSVAPPQTVGNNTMGVTPVIPATTKPNGGRVKPTAPIIPINATNDPLTIDYLNRTEQLGINDQPLNKLNTPMESVLKRGVQSSLIEPTVADRDLSTSRIASTVVPKEKGDFLTDNSALIGGIAQGLPIAAKAIRLLREKPEVVNTPDYMPQDIDLTEQRNELARRATGAKASAVRNMRGNLAGQLAATTAYDEQLGSQLGQSYMTESAENVQQRNRAGMFNTQITQQDNEATAKEKAAYQEQVDSLWSDISSLGVGLTNDAQRRSIQAKLLKAMQSKNFNIDPETLQVMLKTLNQTTK